MYQSQQYKTIQGEKQQAGKGCGGYTQGETEEWQEDDKHNVTWQKGSHAEREGLRRKRIDKGIVLTRADFLAHQLLQHVSAAPSNTRSLFRRASLSDRVCLDVCVCALCMCLWCMLGSDTVPDKPPLKPSLRVQLSVCVMMYERVCHSNITGDAAGLWKLPW